MPKPNPAPKATQAQTQAQTTLRVRDLSIKLEDKTLLAPISFRLKSGSTLGLVGETGSGKTIMTMAMGGLLPPQLRVSGAVEFPEDLLKMSPNQRSRVLGGKIAYVFQEPLSALNPLHRVGDQIGEAITLKRSLADKSLREEIINMANRVQLAKSQAETGRILNAFPHQLSGGQRQRVLIAIAIANRPSLLIADEPTTALDAPLRLEIISLLLSLQREMGMSMIVISHDISMILAVADDVIILKNGKCVERGDRKVLSKPKSDYARLLLREPLGRKTPKDKKGEPVFVASAVSVSYSLTRGIFRRKAGEVKALQNASFELFAGRTLALLGESGSGKTTLAQSMLKLLPFSGEMSLLGKSLKELGKKETRQLRAQLAIVLQDPFSSLSPRMNVADIIGEGLRVHRGGYEIGEITAQLNRVGLDSDLAYNYPHELSGGQRQRVALARSLVLRPKVIVLDEPTSALDRKTENDVLDLLERIQREDKIAYLLITHDIRVAKRLADYMMVMRLGRIIEQGETNKVMDDPQQDYTRFLASPLAKLIAKS